MQKNIGKVIKESLVDLVGRSCPIENIGTYFLQKYVFSPSYYVTRINELLPGAYNHRVKSRYLALRRFFSCASRLRAHKHQNLLEYHRLKKESKPYRETLNSPISNYVSKPARATSRKQVKVRSNFILSSKLNNDISCPINEVKKLPKISRAVRFGLALSMIRDNPLRCGLLKVWMHRLNSRYPRFYSNLQRYVYSESSKFQPNMDAEGAHGSDVPVKVEQSSNVVVEHQEDVDKGAPTDRASGFKGLLACSTAFSDQQIEYFTSRWLKLAPFEWKTEHKKNGLLNTIYLPYDAFNANRSSPNIMAFLFNRYSRFDMRVRFEPTSQRLQVGSLQISWLYNSNTMDEEEKRRFSSVYAGSQRNHVLMQASSSNPVELDIPYWQLWPVSSLRNFHVRDAALAKMEMVFGEIQVRVLNPLLVAGKTSTSINITPFVQFYNTEVRGMLDGSVDWPYPKTNLFEPQMDVLSNVVKSAEMLTNLPILRNLDNPPVPLPPNQIRPRAACSLAVGDNLIDPLDSLRLDARGQTPSLNQSDSSSMSIMDVCRRWSLLKTIQWSTAEKIGVLLFSMPCAPLLQRSLYDSEAYMVGQVNQGVNKYYLPILASVSQLFGYWRGDLEIRLDFVSTMFHAGALQLSVVPGYMSPSIEIEVAKNSSAAVFKLKDSKQCVFSIPYYGNIPFWPVEENISDISLPAPSYFFIHILNALKVSGDVSPAIDINIYIRCGLNFEVALPRTPAFAIAHKEVKLPESHAMRVNPGWSAMFTSGSRWTAERLCCFYNETTDYFTQFDNCKFGKVYQVPTTINIGGQTLPLVLNYYDASGAEGSIDYLVRCYQYANYPVCMCFSSLSSAKSYAKTKDYSHGLLEKQQGAWIFYKQKQGDQEKRVDLSKEQVASLKFNEVKIIGAEAEFEFLPQAESSSVVTPILYTEKSAPCSPRSIFGEIVADFKSMCRRYQYYGGAKCDVVQTKWDSLAQASPFCVISLHPCRPFEIREDGSALRSNRLRDGVIGLLGNAYAGYRGSLRLKIILSPRKVVGGITFVAVHRFDEGVELHRDAVTPLSYSAAHPTEVIFDTAYASALQYSSVNNVMEVEIPFYRPGEYCSTYPVRSNDLWSLRNFSGLGRLYLYGHFPNDESSIDVDVFYSIGDDFSFSLFQGFGPMLAVNDILPEMDTISNWIKVPASINQASEVMVETLKTCGASIVSALDSVKTAVSNVSSSNIIRNGKDFLTNIFELCKGVGITVFTQLLQVIANPTFYTIGIALFSILTICSVGTDFFSLQYNNVISSVKDLWTWATCQSKQNTWQESSNEYVPNGEEMDKTVPERAISLIWSIVLNVSGVVGAGASSVKDIAKGLFMKSSDMFRTHVFGVKFFKDFLDLLKRMFSKINTDCGLSSNFYNLFQSQEDQKEKLTDWLLRSDVLLDPRNQHLLEKNDSWKTRLFEQASIGKIIYIQSLMAKNNIGPNLAKAIADIHKRLDEKVREMLRKRLYAPFRRRPVSFWICGPAGLGKTFLANKFIAAYSKQMRLPTPNIYNYTPGQEFHDMLTDQRVIMFDDFLAMANDASSVDVLAQWQMACGTQPMSLPRSHVDDKKVQDEFDIVMTTSNMFDFASVNNINCKEAFDRRIDMKIELVPLDRNFNSRNVKPGSTVSALWKAKVFKLGAQTPCTYTTEEELLQAMFVTYNEHMAIYEENYQQQLYNHLKALDDIACESDTFDSYVKKLREYVTTNKDKESIRNWCLDLANSVFERFVQRSKSNLKTNACVALEEATKEIKNRLQSEGQQHLPSTSADGCAVPQMDIDDCEIEPDEDLAPDDPRFDCSAYAPGTRPLVPCFKWDASLLDCTSDAEYSCNPIDYVDGCAHSQLFMDSIAYLPLSDGYRLRLNEASATFRQKDLQGILVSEQGELVRCAWASPCLDRSGAQLTSCILLAKNSVGNKLTSIVYSQGCQRALFTSDSPNFYYNKLIMSNYMYAEFLDKNKIESAKVKSKKSRAWWYNLVCGGLKDDLIEIEGIRHLVTAEEIRLQKARNSEDIVSQDCFKVTKKIYKWNKVSQKLESEEITCMTGWFKTLVIIGGIICFLAYTCMFLDIIIWFFDFYGIVSFFKANPEMAVSGDISTSKGKVDKLVSAVKLMNPDPNGMVLEGEAQIGVCPKMSEINLGILKKIERNTFWLFISREVDGKLEQKTARCLGLKGSKALVLTHYLDFMGDLINKDDSWKLYMLSAKDRIPINLAMSELIVTKTCDSGYCVVTLPKRIPAFSDIVKFMRHEGSYCPSAQGLLVEVNKFDRVTNPSFNYHALDLSFYSYGETVSSLNTMNGWTTSSHYQYDMAGFGLCGSFLFDPTDQKRPLLGIHTAGKKNKRGICELLLYETFQTAVNREVVYITPNLDCNSEYIDTSFKECSVVGFVEPEMRVIGPKITKIESSQFSDLWVSSSEPAPLARGDPRLPSGVSPLWEGVKKRMHPVKAFPKRLVEQALDDYERLILAKCKPIREVRPLTINEAIVGVPGVLYMDAMEFKTSEGYPWVKMRPANFSDKRWLLDIDYSGPYPQCVGINPTLQDTLDSKSKLRKRGVVPATYFTACLKDARIPKEKVGVVGKTRLFEMSPIDLTISQRQLHLDFYASFLNCKFDLEHTVGINVNGFEWSLLYSRLMGFEDCILAGDYSNYGPSANQDILFRLLDIIKKWYIKYSEEKIDEVEYDALAHECIHGLVIADRFVFRAISGLHSGNAATVILNSMLNSIYFRVAYLSLATKYRIALADCCSFKKYTCLYSNGDDVICSISPMVKDFFNNTNLSLFFAEYGIKYTNSKKDATTLDYESIWDVTYLKCSFVKHPFRVGCVNAKLDENSIKDCVLWVWRSALPLMERSILNMEQSLRLAYGWGPAYFDKLRSIYLNRLLDSDIYHPMPTWMALDAMVWDDGFDILTNKPFSIN